MTWDRGSSTCSPCSDRPWPGGVVSLFRAWSPMWSSAHPSWRGIPPRCWCGPPAARTCWWWAARDTADSRGGARLGQPVLRASCPLSCAGHSRDRLGRAMTSTVVNSKTCEISEPGASMLAFLRYDLGLTAVKLGCGRVRAARERARGRRAGPGVPDQGRLRGRTRGHHDRRAGWLRWRGAAPSPAGASKGPG